MKHTDNRKCHGNKTAVLLQSLQGIPKDFIKIDWEWTSNGTFGAKVYLNGELILDRHPSFVDDYVQEEILDDLLRELGYNVEQNFINHEIMTDGVVSNETSN